MQAVQTKIDTKNYGEENSSKKILEKTQRAYDNSLYKNNSQ